MRCKASMQMLVGVGLLQVLMMMADRHVSAHPALLQCLQDLRSRPCWCHLLVMEECLDIMGWQSLLSLLKRQHWQLVLLQSCGHLWLLWLVALPHWKRESLAIPRLGKILRILLRSKGASKQR